MGDNLNFNNLVSLEKCIDKDLKNTGLPFKNDSIQAQDLPLRLKSNIETRKNNEIWAE